MTIALTGQGRLSHKLNAYGVAALCDASMRLRVGDVIGWSRHHNDAARLFERAARAERAEACIGQPADPAVVEVDIEALTDTELFELVRQIGAKP